MVILVRLHVLLTFAKVHLFAHNCLFINIRDQIPTVIGSALLFEGASSILVRLAALAYLPINPIEYPSLKAGSFSPISVLFMQLNAPEALIKQVDWSS